MGIEAITDPGTRDYPVSDQKSRKITLSTYEFIEAYNQLFKKSTPIASKSTAQKPYHQLNPLDKPLKFNPITLNKFQIII